MSNKKKILPELRFPEFFGEGEWSLKELEECLDYLQPTPFLVRSTEYDSKYDVPVLTAGKTFILGYTNEEDGIFDDNLPVIIFDDFTTASKFVDFPFKAKSSAMKILISKNGNNTRFIYESIQNLKFEVGGHKRHWISVFSKLKIAVPRDFKEQEKIGDCLSSLDELIEAHKSKLDILKDHKKGLMQNLFPQEGQKFPNYRFSEFTEPLRHFYFRDLGSIKIGLTHKPEYFNSGIPFLSSKNISAGYIDFEDVQYISKEKFDSMPDSTKPKVGDILFTRVGSNLGNPIILEEDRVFAIFVSLGFFRVNKKVHNRYIKYWMESDYFWKQVNQKVAGGAKNNLNSTWLKEFELYVPNIIEQQKIASTLHALDRLISVQLEKIKQLQQHKKGLMQGLFPKTED